LLGVLVGVEGAEAIVGKIFVGLLIAAGIWVVGWAAMKREEASLDARKREKNDRSRKVSEAGSALSAIERSIREKDRKMKEIFESLSVKESVSSSRAGDLGEE
jgi:transcription initiation factor TFIIIB Brf1 subunit/transcription initiation factor TFIIB